MPLAIGEPYSSAQIAAGLGWAFPGESSGPWQHGAIHRDDGVLIRVTLDKSGFEEKYRYSDRFLSPEIFIWKSQRRTTPDSAKGRDYSATPGRKTMHLCVRRKKRAETGPALYRYLGEVLPATVTGSRPMTVTWRLRVPVAPQLWHELAVPGAASFDDPPTTIAASIPSARTEELAAAAELVDAVSAGQFRVEDTWSLTRQRAAGAVFRALVLERFGSKCVMCGIDDPRLLDAAHVVPWAESPEHRLNPENGLCLCVLHHRAWDRGLMEIRPDGSIASALPVGWGLPSSDRMRPGVRLTPGTAQLLARRTNGRGQ